MNTTFERRLKTLEGTSGMGDALVVSIKSFMGIANDPVRIVRVGGGEWLRDEDESVEDFRHRAQAGPHRGAFVVLREYNRTDDPSVKQWSRYPSNRVDRAVRAE